MRLVINAGSSQFGLQEQFTTLTSAASLVETLTHPDCDGFILVPEPGAMAQGLAGMFMMSLLNRIRVRRTRRATN